MATNNPTVSFVEEEDLSKGSTTVPNPNLTAPAGSGGGAGGNGGKGGSGGGSGGIKKTNDKPLVAALEDMLKGYRRQYNIRVRNIVRERKQSRQNILKGYREQAKQLRGSRRDNAAAEMDSTFANLANRARERMEIREQTAALGAGESDTLRAQAMALRNWDANQGEIDRSYYDTERSINNAIAELNSSTRANLFNAYNSAANAQAQVWDNYSSQRQDALTQIGNVQSNPYSDAYKKGSDTFKRVAKSVAKGAKKNSGVPAHIRNWEGPLQPKERPLNRSHIGAAQTVALDARPEGATLRRR